MTSGDAGTVGVVMAGGASERMRRSGIATPKPLVTVGGEPLLARAVGSLVAAGVGHVVVTTAARQPEVAHFVESTCRPPLERHGVAFSVIVETEPLGSLGGLGLLPASVDVALVVNADNLSTLDLGAVLDVHRQRAAAMTVTVRDEPFTMPFGEVDVTDGHIVRYTEKPVVTFVVCSAVCVLGAAALERLRPARFVMLPQFVNELLVDGLPVAACPDEAEWIDVNDVVARTRAEALAASGSISLPSLLDRVAGTR